MSIKPLILEAEKLLKKNPYDIAHDISHHRRVWVNAQKIIKSENLNVDKHAVRVSCMWHDVVLEPKDEQENRQKHIDEMLEYLQQTMDEENFDKSFQKTVADAIRDHGFEKKKQTNLVGEILFDADKLDLLSPLRYRKVVQAIKNKQLSEFKIFLLKNSVKFWLKTMRNRYHFETSKKMHDKRIHDLLKDKEVVQMAKKLGVDIPKLVK